MKFKCSTIKQRWHSLCDRVWEMRDGLCGILLPIVIILSFALFQAVFVYKFYKFSVHFSIWMTQSGKLVDTPTCHISEWPVFDVETSALFVNTTAESNPCEAPPPPLLIQRRNFTWIEIQAANATEWNCVAEEVIQCEGDYFDVGPATAKLGPLTDFAANHWASGNGTKKKLWDAAQINCSKNGTSYAMVVPLVQYYTRPERVPPPSKDRPKVNLLVLGIDSVSRLQFHRYMPQTKALLEEHGFQPMYGYHKVGENSFPNVFPILSGEHPNRFVSDEPSVNFTWDDVPLIFHDLKARGYLTSFIEDMPEYGFFTYDQKGFRKQPTDYYLRPTNWAMKKELDSWCYKGRAECELYYDYIADQLDAFRARGNQSYFIFNHESTVTHNYADHVGYMDRPMHSLLRRIFAAGHHENTAIFLFADHAIRYGELLQTASSIHETRLPVFWMYLPDSLSLDGLNVTQLRALAAVNTYRLTSHFDMHATMVHIITGSVPQNLTYGRSLLAEIPLNRTCAMAGIPVQYCLCAGFEAIKVTPQVKQHTEAAVAHINSLVSKAGNSCVPVDVKTTFRAFNSTDADGNSYQLLHFQASPSDGIYEAFLQLTEGRNGTLPVPKVHFITRLDAYGHQSRCVEKNRILSPLCYCRDYGNSR